MTAWSDELTDLAKSMYLEGRSASQIVRSLASKGALCLTRSAVQGKIHRLGLSRSKEAQKEAMSIKQKPPPKPDKAGQRPAKTVGDVSLARINQLPLVSSNPVTVMDVQRHHCRWPILVYNVEFFCGAEISKGSFCVHHARVAYSRDE